jgi:hypothetical protein
VVKEASQLLLAPCPAERLPFVVGGTAMCGESAPQRPPDLVVVNERPFRLCRPRLAYCSSESAASILLTMNPTP